MRLIRLRFQLDVPPSPRANLLDVQRMNVKNCFSTEGFMVVGPYKSEAPEKTRILLGLLESVERGEVQSQRRLASELGIALGLVNLYLKRCVRKGLIKVRDAPARRYAYYLTPNGFAEKARLTVEYLSVSLTLYREAKKDCTAIMLSARERGISRVAIIGASDLAEIATICALDLGIAIVAVVDSRSTADRILGFPVVKSFDEIDGLADAVLVADMRTTRKAINVALARYGPERVLVPNLLGLGPAEQRAEQTRQTAIHVGT
jgi:DNA-binding MarR family transcriptional regulator